MSDSNSQFKNGILFLGFVNNLGHFIWNELSGIQELIDNGNIDRLKSIYIGPFAQLPLIEIFPELNNAEIKFIYFKKSDYKPINLYFNNNQKPLRITGNRITIKLRERLISWALAKQYINISQLEQLNTLEYNIWFNIRSHNKTWMNQVEGIVYICKYLLKLIPGVRLRIFLDGTPDTNIIVKEIKSKCKHLAFDIIDATNVELSKTITLCCLIDLHISVIGSGLVIPTWILGKKGIAHSNSSHISQGIWWNQISEGSNNTQFISKKYISDLWYPSIHNFGYVNYFINLNGLIDKLKELILSIDPNPRQTYVNKMIYYSRRKNFEFAAKIILNL